MPGWGATGWHGFRFWWLIAHLLNPLAESRLLKTLQNLMELPALDLRDAFTEAAQRISETLGCDKVDAFLFDEAKQTLRAVGTSQTPMGRLQLKLGLDALALANGGSVVRVFKTGRSELQADCASDPEELRGIVNELGVRSSVAVAFDVNGQRRGVLSTMSAQPGFFQANDQQFLEVVASCLGLLAQRTEFVEHARRVEAEHARRAGADEMITVLAHDFRNHLQPLQARLQLMRLHSAAERLVSTSDVDGALRSVQRLTRLTNDLLDLKRLDEGLFTLNLLPVDLVNMAHETRAAFETQTRPIHVTGVPELVYIADSDRLRQVLENLVANALKYAPPGSAVQLRVDLRQGQEGESAVLEVADEGPGISPQILPTLFERYVSGAESHGLGLGLHLARHIVRLHGGELSVTSKPGAGTSFRITLPLDAACLSTRAGAVAS